MAGCQPIIMIKRLFLALSSFLLISLIIGYSRQILKLIKASQGLKTKEEEISLLEKKNQELKQKLEEVKSDSYIENEAREKLGMAKPGEAAVIMPSISTNKPINTNEEKREPNWKKWWRLFAN